MPTMLLTINYKALDLSMFKYLCSFSPHLHAALFLPLFATDNNILTNESATSLIPPQAQYLQHVLVGIFGLPEHFMA